MSFIIAGVFMIGLVAVLVLFLGKPKDGSKGSAGKTKAQIIREANKRLAKNPHDPIALMSLGDVYFTNQLWDKAHSTYSQLVKLALANKDGVIDLYQAFLRVGICCINLQDKDEEAIQALSNAIRLNGTAYEPNYYLGKTMFKMQLYDKAVPLFKKALMADPTAHGVYFSLGQCLYNAKKYRESLPALKKALDEEPGNKEALYDMADAMTKEGHGDKAIKVFMHLRADPVYGARSCLQAGIFHIKTSCDAAIQDLEIGLKHENAEPETKIDIMYNLARCYFEKNLIPKGLGLLKQVRSINSNYKDTNTLINRYQELSQNSNLQVYVSSNSSDFVTLCRKFITTKYRNSTIKIQNIDVDVLYTDILAEIYSSKWEDVALFRFFRTTGSTGEIYVREFHGHMSDVKAARGFCISAGTFTEDARRYIDGRPIDLIEKNDLTKVLKQISL